MSEAKSGSAPQMKVVERKFTIRNKYGIHARPAALLVKTANKFESEITVEKDGFNAPAKSIMGLLSLEGVSDSEITIKAIGADAEAAVEAIGHLINEKFFEA
jgi:phosphocarrier protein